MLSDPRVTAQGGNYHTSAEPLHHECTLGWLEEVVEYVETSA